MINNLFLIVKVSNNNNNNIELFDYKIMYINDNGIINDKYFNHYN